jgi:rod shape-determining protein MreC
MIKVNVEKIKETKIENDKLANENLKFRFKLSQLKEIENENKTLREELELNKKVKFQTEATLVLGQNLSQNRRIIYLDKGEKNGFSEGDSVVLSDGILIGKITKVYPTSAEAELILDKNNRINAEIQEIGIKGIVQGEYGTSVIMGMIPQSAEVKENQTVITSGLGGEFPRGLLIGRIKEVEMTIDRLFQQASIESPVEFRDLRMVWVINNK